MLINLVWFIIGVVVGALIMGWLSTEPWERDCGPE